VRTRHRVAGGCDYADTQRLTSTPITLKGECCYGIPHFVVH
jgi:hypothetical protein